MSRLALSLLVLAACADVGPFRSTDGESLDAGLSDGPDLAPPVKLATSTKSPGQLALTSGFLYMVELGSHGIVSFPRNGGDALIGDAGGAPLALAAGGTTMYWIVSLPRNGGDALIGDAGGTPLALAAGGTSMYWIVDHTVMSFEESASQPKTRLTSPTLVAALGVSATDAFTIDAPPNAPGSISRLANTGGAATTVLGGLASPRAVAASGSMLVWESGSSVKRASLASLGSAQTIGTDQASVGTIVFDGTHACWTNATAVEVFDVWCAGPGAAQRIATSQIQVNGLALTSTHLYYTHRPTANANYSTIESYELATGAKRTLRETADRYPSSLAADDDALYWVELYASGTTGEIWRMALR